MADLIDRHEAIDIVRNTIVKEVTPAYALIDKAEVMTELMMMPSAQPEQSIAQERYEDLCEYFKDCSDQGRSTLNDRKEFKSWLDRMKWHVMECDKLGRELMKIKSTQPEKRTEERTKTHACDLISRQAAIDAYGDWYVEEGTEDGFIGTVKQLLEGLPSAQPYLQQTCNQLATDCISRQAALDALEKLSANYTGVGKREWHPHIRECQYEIEHLPSVQPPARCIAEIKIDKDELEELVAKSMTNIAQPEQFNPCTVCQEFDCTGCKFRRT